MRPSVPRAFSWLSPTSNVPHSVWNDPGGFRTHDLRIKSPLLYQLSYRVLSAYKIHRKSIRPVASLVAAKRSNAGPATRHSGAALKDHKYALTQPWRTRRAETDRDTSPLGKEFVSRVTRVTGANMPFTFSKVNAVIRAVRMSRQREVAAARMAALEESNHLLQTQARQLEHQTREARELAHELALTNEELRSAMSEARKAWQAADAANRSKAEFLAVMSHELRTPLNSIGGYVDLLEMELRGPLTDSQKSDLQRIKRGQQLLLRIINDILNFTRLEATEVKYDIIDVPLRALLTDLDAVVSSLATAKALHYDCAVPPGGVFTRTDPDKLRQILINLLSNAVKFTPAGGRIKVSCATQEKTVSISVEDNGPGIPAEKLEAVFEPFVQLDRGLTRTTEGTGLGLAISRGLARGMGAEITLKSQLGKGSVFTLVLPLVRTRMTPSGSIRAVHSS
jgi:signal transduction histidine kinase